MLKRVVIAGCIDYNNYDEAKLYIDFCLSDIKKEYDIIIVSGCASGADAIGERYAKENGFEVENALLTGENTAEAQGRGATSKWLESATL